MVSGPPEIDVGLWVGTQVTCPGARLHHGTSGGTSRLSALASAVPRLPAGKTGPAVSFPYLTQRQWYFLASFSWFCFFLDSCWNGPPRSQHQPPAHSWCSCAAGMAAAGCPSGRMERWPVPGEVARTDYLLQAINCRPSPVPRPPVPPAPFLQLIPHFLSKIPRELLVCVFPRHVLICHPLPLTGSHNAGFSGSPSLQLAAVSGPGWWPWCDHQERQVPPAPCQETLPPLHLPVPIESPPSGSQTRIFF